MSFNALVTLIEVGGSIGLFHLAKVLGASDVVSYLVGSIGPVVGGRRTSCDQREAQAGLA